MAKNNPAKIPFETKGKAATKPAPAAPKVETHAIRETFESIVIAFVLAFLFRTFEAEAFVIPTGSMAPTLMGRHKDVECPKCGYRYEVTASDEETEDPTRRPPSECIAGSCPMCRYVMPMTPKLPNVGPDQINKEIGFQPSYNGDRILVNKYLYAFSDPKRWDVVVFKFPGDAKTNYIKRLVGLPGETLRIQHGDVFIRPAGSDSKAEFQIERKPPNKVLAMRQLVHDTSYDPAGLDQLGWPLRWHTPPGEAEAWQLQKTIAGKDVRQTYNVDAKGDSTAWLRYEHLVPTYEVWQQAEGNSAAGAKPLFAGVDRSRLRRLITDANPYNGRIDRLRYPGRMRVDETKLGLHWVSDLMVEATVNVESSTGTLILDLVRAGKHFNCAIDLKTGEAKLTAAELPKFAPTAMTSLKGPGQYHLRFANFDEQLLLWVDGKLTTFSAPTTYDAVQVFGNRDDIIPQTSAKDLGDFAPVGIGARDAKLSVSNLQVWRDLYYIADRDDLSAGSGLVTDFDRPLNVETLELTTNPKLWGKYRERRAVEFPLSDEQLFVMGDNSSESSDARLWKTGDEGTKKPGGAYLDKRLLIGKALCVYWPHSWNRIPGTPIPFPLFPNFEDMRLVR